MAEKLTSSLNIDYDPEGDVLYAFLGKPFPTTNFEVDFNFTLQFDPDTKRLAGMTVHNFSSFYPTARKHEEQLLIAGAWMGLFQQLVNEHKLKEPLSA